MKTQSNKEAKDKQSSPELPIQRKGEARFDDNRSEATVQRKLQAGMKEATTQQGAPIQAKANNTGLPNNLKSGIENLSGFAMDDVKVHYNSSKPAQLQAHAYAQGSDIHLAPGQEKHLAHEAWHVVQQKQGRVKPTRQLKSKVAINDDDGLEKEADEMGAKAMLGGGTVQRKELQEGQAGPGVVQRVPVERPGWVAIGEHTWRSEKEAHVGWEWILEEKGGELLMRLEISKKGKLFAASGMEFLTRHGEMTYEKWVALGRDSELVLKDVINPNIEGAGPDTTHPHAGLEHWEDVATVAQNGRGLDALQNEMWGDGETRFDTFNVRSAAGNVGKREQLARIHPSLEALIAVPALMIDDVLFNEFLNFAMRFQDKEGLPLHIGAWDLLKRFGRTKGALKVYRALVLDRGIVGARPTPRSYGKLLAAHCVQQGAACNLSQQPGNMELTLKSHVRSSSTQPRVFQSVTTIKPLAIAVANKQLQGMRNQNNMVVVLFTMAIPFLDMVFFNHVDSSVFATELVEWGKGTKFHKNRRYDQATEMIVTGNIPQKDILSIEIIDDHAKYGVVEEDGNKF